MESKHFWFFTVEEQYKVEEKTRRSYSENGYDVEVVLALHLDYAFLVMEESRPLKWALIDVAAGAILAAYLEGLALTTPSSAGPCGSTGSDHPTKNRFQIIGHRRNPKYGARVEHHATTAC
ncbi:hypothetical protein C5167_020971 [Papaver somniferum]|uniref:Uncharacterized protein n=1 Tax=Papaver somniferum TaxID=3469 RepID=A0A4Y7IUK1_PAPSO|nr:hypothetical protein C5167_020971 [Papaver somniferum]